MIVVTPLSRPGVCVCARVVQVRKQTIAMVVVVVDRQSGKSPWSTFGWESLAWSVHCISTLEICRVRLPAVDPCPGTPQRPITWLRPAASNAVPHVKSFSLVLTFWGATTTSSIDQRLSGGPLSHCPSRSTAFDFSRKPTTRSKPASQDAQV